MFYSCPVSLPHKQIFAPAGSQGEMKIAAFLQYCVFFVWQDENCCYSPTFLVFLVAGWDSIGVEYRVTCFTRKGFCCFDALQMFACWCFVRKVFHSVWCVSKCLEGGGGENCCLYSIFYRPRTDRNYLKVAQLWQMSQFTNITKHFGEKAGLWSGGQYVPL